MAYPSIKSSIYELMRDLGQGLNDPETLMLGGGNPAILDASREFFKPILTRLIENSDFFRKAFQSYSHPQGEERFVQTVRDYFEKVTGWTLSSKNICITQGSQQGFFMLYNYLIGKNCPFPTSQFSRPVLVLVKTPDYIGYFDLIPRDQFLSVEGIIEEHGDGSFSYEIDFPTLEKLLDRDGEDYTIQGLVISTPNNPSSHALSQTDADRLCHLAQEYDKLIIFDHAYGFPFPNIIFEDKICYSFTPHTLHCFSFSKIGLPGLRAGILIGDLQLIEKMIILNGVINLSPSSFTSGFLSEVLVSPGFDEYIQNSLRHHYVQKKNIAYRTLMEKLRGLPTQLHRPQGGFFLWLRIPDFPLDSYQLYKILKQKKVIVVPGNYFFLKEPSEAYLRISYTMEEKKVIQGLEIIGDTLHEYYSR